MSEGLIFDIAEGSIHDGPGLRITVFMKGCPLTCPWCHSPEGRSTQPVLMRFPHGERLAGKYWTAQELADYLVPRLNMLGDSGGVTFSGGEPLMQSSFILEVLEYLGGKYHVMLDSSGYGKYTDLLALAQQCDLIAFGIKLLNAEPAQKFTGQDGGCICRNIARLDKTGTVPYYFRMPLVPGVTDTEENFRALYEFAAPLKNLQYLEFLPYNQAAGAKYAALNLPDSASRWANRSADPIPDYIKNSFEIIEHK